MLQFLITTLALLIIMVTMFLRAYDLKLKGLRWNVRRIGFCLAGFSPIGIIVQAYRTNEYGGWYMTAFLVGITLVFMTTPYLPPWHKWIWKDFSEREVA